MMGTYCAALAIHFKVYLCIDLKKQEVIADILIYILLNNSSIWFISHYDFLIGQFARSAKNYDVHLLM